MKRLKAFILPAVLLGMFLLLTAAVEFVDVEPVAPDGSEVGFAAVNCYVHKAVGVHMLWYDITDWLGISAVLTAFFFGCLGAVQLFKRKSLFKVDRDIIALGLLYIGVIASYVFFELFVVNCRPVLMNGAAEASYPSSHTMIVIAVMGTAVTQCRLRIKNALIRRCVQGVLWAVIFVTVIGRFISGVHWFTDILGGMLLGSFFCALYSAAITE